MKPNIIYILADDMGYGDVSCLNPSSKIQTRHLDALAADGMRFTDAHATSAVCTPSRYGILTGRYNWRSWLKRGVAWSWSPPVIEPDRMTVASYLHDHDYTTGCIGKWHLGWNWARCTDTDAPVPDERDLVEADLDLSKPIERGPTTVGFDHFFGIAASLDIPPYIYIDDDQPTAAPDGRIQERTGKEFWREGPISPDFEHADVLPRLTHEALGFIDAHAQEDQPFFLYFPLPAPHTPILPSAEFQGASNTNAYGDFCLMVDDVVGQVMAKLEEHGIAEDTILVFTSDNGCSPQADFDELAAVGHHPSHFFRGHKADIYEGGHRIPLIIRWPAQIRAGSTSDQTVCLVDLLATCADILGDALPDNAGEDSVSNLPLWRGETPGSEPDGDSATGSGSGTDSSSGTPLREATVHHSIDGSFSIRAGRWKLEMCPGSGGWSPPRPGEETEGMPPIQLYDLDADIGERTNVQDQHPDVVERLQTLLTKYVEAGRSTPGAPQVNTGGNRWEQLWWM